MSINSEMSFIKQYGRRLRLLALFIFFTISAYVYIDYSIFTKMVLENVGDSIKNPPVKGFTVKEYEGDKGGFSLNISALYSFESKRELFSGLADICSYYNSLGWKEVTTKSGGCDTKIAFHSKSNYEKYIRGKVSYTFCLQEGVRVRFYYASKKEDDPWGLLVSLHARKDGSVCSA